MAPGTNLYATVLFIHILSVVVWVGGGIMLMILNIRSKGRGAEAMQQFAEDAEFVGKKILGSASGVAVLTGLAMVLFSGGAWTFKEPWIAIGIAGWIVSMIIGAGMIGPAAKKVGALIPEKGLGDPEVEALGKRIRMLSRIDIILLVVVIWDMTYKPFS